jgi:hypothetical protein
MKIEMTSILQPVTDQKTDTFKAFVCPSVRLFSGSWNYVIALSSPPVRLFSGSWNYVIAPFQSAL